MECHIVRDFKVNKTYKAGGDGCFGNKSNP